MRPRSYFARDESRAAPTPARMAEILAQRTNRSAGSSPDASAVTGAVPGRGLEALQTSSQLSLQEQQDALRELSGAPPLEQVYRDEPNRPAREITQTVQLPQGYKPQPAALEWGEPMRHPNGEATQISLGGAYEVAGRRCPQGFIFHARHGLDVLGSFSSAQEARDCCQAHFMRACGADNG